MKTSKTVYVFDDNLWFSHVYEAQADPMTEGQFIAPINSLDVAPTIVNGFWPVENNGAWVNTLDCRGNVWDVVTGEPSVYEELGALPGNLTAVVKPDPNATWENGAWVVPPTVLPANVTGFLSALFDSTEALQVNALALAYPAFIPAVQLQHWSTARGLLTDAVSKSVISSAQLDAIMLDVTQFNIPWNS